MVTGRRRKLGAYVDEAAKRVGCRSARASAGRDPFTGVLIASAALVMEFPLPDDVEPAPVFRP
jgi:hypothetical protein